MTAQNKTLQGFQIPTNLAGENIADFRLQVSANNNAFGEILPYMPFQLRTPKLTKYMAKDGHIFILITNLNSSIEVAKFTYYARLRCD